MPSKPVFASYSIVAAATWEQLPATSASAGVTIKARGSNAANVELADSSAPAAGAIAVLEPGQAVPFDILTSTDKIWIRGSIGDDIDIFGSRPY